MEAQHILLTRGKVLVDLPKDLNRPLSKQLLGTICKNLSAYGFILTKEVLDKLEGLQQISVSKWYKEISTLLKEMVGANVKHRPMYPNFPKQVMNMDEAELYIRAIIYYLSGWSEDFPIWILGILYSGVLNTVDELQIGYVMNDDAISFIEDIKKSYYSFSPLIDLKNKKLPKIVFPLTKRKKYMLAEELPKQLFSETFSCENVKIIESKTKIDDTELLEFYNCGECVPCQREKREKYINLIKA